MRSLEVCVFFCILYINTAIHTFVLDEEEHEEDYQGMEPME